MAIDKHLRLEPLVQLLEKVYNTEYGYIYLQGEFPYKSDTLGLMFFTDRYDSNLLETQHAEFMKKHGLKRIMQIVRAEDAMRNAFTQKKDVTNEELVACFNFHYKNSGYLNLSNT